MSSSTPLSSTVNAHTEVTREVQEATNDTEATLITRRLKIMSDNIENDKKGQDK